jgi:glycosyltransferase involved in cell wall biosynthesis
VKNQMRIGVAIPCYKPHLPLLERCLDSIEAQTRKPDEVVVVCSSADDKDVPTYSYSFPLRILTRPDRHNAAENRNYAARQMTSEMISFFDADDVMHPQRLEAIEGCGLQHIILHSFLDPHESFESYSRIYRIRNTLRQYKTGCACLGMDWAARIHHAHVTIHASVLSQTTFPEDKELERREDAIFCGSVLNLSPTIQSTYIVNPMSRYHETGQTIDEEYLRK